MNLNPIEIPGGMNLHDLQLHASGDLCGYITGMLAVDGYDLEVLFRVKDDSNGPAMNLVSVDYGQRHNSVQAHWDDIQSSLCVVAEEWKGKLQEELDSKAGQALSQHCYKGNDGIFYYEAYDVKPELPEAEIRALLSHEGDKQDALTSILYEHYQDDTDEAHSFFYDKLDEMLNADPVLKNMADICGWEILYYLDSHWSYTIPVEDYLNLGVELNIVVDTGDLNYDFSCNNFCHGYYGDPESPSFPEGSSLIWLCEQQGVSEQELFKVMKHETLMPYDMYMTETLYHNYRDALATYGFKPNRPHLCTGKYAEYQKIRSSMLKIKHALSHAENVLESNSLSYEEAIKKFPSAIATYPNEEIFRAAQESVLPKNEARIADLNEQNRALQEKLSGDADLFRISKLYENYMHFAAKLEEYKKTPDYQKAKFVDSVIAESANVTSSINALTFLVKMPLKSAMELNDILQAEHPLNLSYDPSERTGQSSIILGKDSVCGLYDFIHGAGSNFEIELSKDVELPLSLIHSAQVDNTLGHGVKGIWGEMEYSETLKEIRNAQTTKSLDFMLQTAQQKVSNSEIEHSRGEANLDRS